MIEEEPKKYPIGGYAPGSYSCKCFTCNTMFMGDKRAHQCEPCAIKIDDFFKSFPSKQETLEEAAEKYILHEQKSKWAEVVKSAFKDGAKWQAKRMFSEEEVLAMLLIKHDGLSPEYVLEQFKKNNNEQ